MPSVISGDANVSATEFGYLDGVTSAIQTQLGGKADTTGNGAWTSWTPTATNYTVGNGTVTARYVQLGKSVLFRFNFVLGSTSAISGDLNFTLPVTATTNHVVHGILVDTGNNVYPAVASLTSASCAVRAINTAGTYAQFTFLSSSIPFTWGSTDEIVVTGIYEAA